MTRTRTTVTLDAKVLTAVRVHAARTGRPDSQVIEDALRRDLGLDLLDQLWATADLDEDSAASLALEGQRAARRSRH